MDTRPNRWAERVARCKPLKPHIVGGFCIVKYLRADDAGKAKVLLDENAKNLGMRELSHLPYKSCSGCRDPACTYDASPGYWIASFERNANASRTRHSRL